MKAKEEECERINSTVNQLLEQDAKRRGVPGTETVRAMSTREAKAAIRSVTQTFNSITRGFNQDMSVANSDLNS